MQAAVAKQLLSEAVAVVQKTFQERKIDCGLSLALKPRASTLLCGAVIADGDKLDKVVKELIAQIRADDPDATKSLKLDAEIHEGVHFHVATTSPSPRRTSSRSWAGRSRWCWPSAADRLYLAAGGHALESLKEAIAKSKAAAGKEVPPLRISAAGTPIAQFAAATLEGSDKLTAAKIAAVLKKSPATDHATLTVTPLPRGLSARLEIEEGLLKVLANVLPGAVLPDAARRSAAACRRAGPKAARRRTRSL